MADPRLALLGMGAYYAARIATVQKEHRDAIQQRHEYKEKEKESSDGS